ncbi:MAG: hypothetical protein SGI72_16295 [Planctomycetota bacterium]|nr:hypothetical protein [Planctomycetota bacterium]
MTRLDDRFNEYFSGLERAGNHDRCYICRRTPAEVKAFFGFEEDGVPMKAAEYGIEDVVFEDADVMSYRGARPVCAVCQLNFDTLFLLGEQAVLRDVLAEMEMRRDHLWPRRET